MVQQGVRELIGNIKGPKGDNGNGIASITLDSSTTDQNNSTITIDTYKIMFTDGSTPVYFDVKSGAQGIQGIQGQTGPAGKDFHIAGTYASISEMNADSSNVDEGEFVMIASNVEDEDNAKLYVKSSNGFTLIGDLSGAQGIKGRGISEITAGTISGTEQNGATRNYLIEFDDESSPASFTVKDGLKGDKGDTGEQGPKGDTGDTGATGAQGPQGDAGLIPFIEVDNNGDMYVTYLTPEQFAAQTNGN